jgi:hypothetical protein
VGSDDDARLRDRHQKRVVVNVLPTAVHELMLIANGAAIPGTVTIAGTPATPTPKLDFTVLGVYYTVASIIIIYHLSTLQVWLQRADDLDREAAAAGLTTAAGDFARDQLKRRCEDHGRKFPWLQIVVLGVAIAALSWLAIDAATQIQGISKRYSIGPTVVLAGTFVLMTAGAKVQGDKRLRDAIQRLT